MKADSYSEETTAVNALLLLDVDLLDLPVFFLDLNLHAFLEFLRDCLALDFRAVNVVNVGFLFELEVLFFVADLHLERALRLVITHDHAFGGQQSADEDEKS